MSFLRFALQSIDFLAWPLLALAYPLCASIRAIETGSKYQMRKLVTYWAIFSFISLCEHVFEKLIQWIPLWPYMKLSVICWLVIPQFNSACYVYENLIHPCLFVKLHEVLDLFYSSCYVHLRILYLCSSLNLPTVTGWFNKTMEDPLKNQTFLAMAERYLEENGSDVLENLIANKSKDCGLNHPSEEEINTADTSEEAGTLSPNQTGCKGESPVWEDIKVMEHEENHEAAEAKQVKSACQLEDITTVPGDGKVTKLAEITCSKKVQTEWTCAICQLSTSSEFHLNSHLNGRKHKAKCDELKTFKQTAKGEENLPVPTKKSNEEQVKVNLAATVVQERPKQLKGDDVAFHESTRPWCGTCRKWCSGEIAMAAHVNGRKHLAKLQKSLTSVAVVESYLEDNAQEKPVTNKVKSVTENQMQIEEKITGHVHVKKTTLSADAEEIKLPETNPTKKIQAEWTCAICQVTTNSEHDLKCHLRGRRHWEKCEELKNFKKTAKIERSLKENFQVGASTGKNEMQKQVKNAGAGTSPNPKLWCGVCNIWCPNEVAMAAHLNGKKHLAKLEETMTFSGRAGAFDYANTQFSQGMLVK